jgi:hypothetical protein
MKLFSKIEEFYDNMLDRERMMVVVAALLTIMFVASVLMFLISDSFSEREIRIGQLDSAITMLLKNRKSVMESKQLLAGYERKATIKPPMLQGHIDEIAKGFELNSGSYNPKKTEELGAHGEYLKESVEVKFHDVDLKKIAQFLDKIEKSKFLLMVTQMKITTRRGHHDKLDPTMIISSFYKRNSKELKERDKKKKESNSKNGTKGKK